MAGEGIALRWFTTGYKKVTDEMDDVAKRAGRMPKVFDTVGTSGAGMAGTISAAFGTIGDKIAKVADIGMGAIGVFTKLAVSIAAIGAIATGIGVALATKFGAGMFRVAETFYLIETSLEGVLKSRERVEQISAWGAEYAAKYPAMYEDIMSAMKGLAMIPSLKPMFVKGAVEDMEKMMKIVQGLGAIDPQQGVRGALYALREALTGQWRTLQMRFEIMPSAIAAAGGMTMEQMKKSPEAGLKALEAFIDLNVGAETLRKTAQSLEIQIGNLSDKYKIWVKDVVLSGGMYQSLVARIMDLNDWLEKMFKSEAAASFARTIQGIYYALEKAVAHIVTYKVDWEKGGIFGNFVQVVENMFNKAEELWKEHGRKILRIFGVAFDALIDMVGFLTKNVFLPMGLEIGRALLDGILGALKERPWLSALLGGITGAKIGAAVGPKGALIGGIIGAGVGYALPAHLMGAPNLSAASKGTVAPWEAAKNKLAVIFESIQGIFAGFQTEVKETTRAVEKPLTLKEYEAALIGLQKLEVQWAAARGAGTVEEQAKLEMQIAAQRELIRGAQTRVQAEQRWRSGRWEEKDREIVNEIARVREKIGKIALTDPDALGQIKQLQTEEARLGGIREDIDTKRQEMYARTAGEEEVMRRRTKEGLEAETKYSEKIKSLSAEIAKMRKDSKSDVGAIVEKEQELYELRQKQNEQLVKQRETARTIVDQMEKLSTMRVEVGRDIWGKLTGYFEKFKEFVTKEGGPLAWMTKIIPPSVAGKLGIQPLEWREAVRAREAGPTAGIPTFFLRQEEMIKGMMEQGGTVASQLQLAEMLYNLNVKQFEMATTPEARLAQFGEATTAFGQLLDLQLRAADQQWKTQLDQLEQLRESVKIQTISEIHLREIALQVKGALVGRAVERTAYGQISIEQLNPAIGWQ